MSGNSGRGEQRWRTAGAASWWPPLAIYVAVLAVLMLLSWTVIHTTTISPQFTRQTFAGDWFWGGWVWWDGSWYRGIAEFGYAYTPGAQSSVAYFPGYPLVMRAVGTPLDNFALAGIATTIASGCAALALFWRWCRVHLAEEHRLVAVALLALFPYAFYLYGAVYSDALFLLLALGSFLLVERDRPVAAGALAAAATATRLVGVAVVVGLFLRVVERRGSIRRLRAGDLGVLLGFAGLAAWMGYLWHRFDDPFLFSTVEQYWGQPSSASTWLKEELFRQIAHGTHLRYRIGIVVQALLAVAALASVPAVKRRFGSAYAAYVLVIVALPTIGSKDFQGLGRYVLAAFPVFALAGDRIASDEVWTRRVVVTFALFLLLQTAIFANGQYVA